MTTDEQGYNGWKNYETWAVNMFLDGNYSGPQDYYAAIETTRNAADLEGLAVHGEYSTPQGRVADALRDFVDEMVNPHMVDDDHPDPDLHPLVKDLLGAALSSVDWREIADAWIEVVKEQYYPDAT